ncbi:hemolysin family protein [Mesobacillus subterraneus]|uniref:HlyC/CorC family transporter n=1 Tax=Mesobacillus subterraneus TaxID=285983 RepID=A0A3R9FWH4_9BACI|nr:hemolysin family protein [Mesobacillus subterraneus]RSD26779.1 HlyC/CorC family transporter [Mesobacillus subterraneus]
MEVPIGLVILLGVLILLSAFFSSAETAFSSVNKIRLRNYASEGRSGSKNALHISENFDDALSTILVGNNIVNIAAASISSKVAVDLFGASTGLIVSTFGMTVLILIFGEILPKSMAKENAETYSLKISGILLLLIKVLTPVNFLFSKLKAFVSRVFSKGDAQPSVTEEEIKVMVDISEEEGVINKDERELVHRSLEFNEILVGEVLTHRMDMITVEVNQPLEEIKQVLLEERFSRIPVYEDNIDNIIGFLSEREFFAALIKNEEEVKVRELLRQPMFVVKSMKIATLLPELQRTKSHMAIVVDEFGGTSGLITLEDILEELVGEIWDEHDEKVNIMTKIDESTYEFDAQYDLDDFAELFNVPMPETSYHNLGGWIFETLESIPENGDTFDYENLKIIVKEVENHRIRKIKVDIMPAVEVEE